MNEPGTQFTKNRHRRNERSRNGLHALKQAQNRMRNGKTIYQRDKKVEKYKYSKGKFV